MMSDPFVRTALLRLLIRLSLMRNRHRGKFFSRFPRLEGRERRFMRIRCTLSVANCGCMGRLYLSVILKCLFKIPSFVFPELNITPLAARPHKVTFLESLSVVLATCDTSCFPGQLRLQPSKFSKPSHGQPDRRP